MPSHFNLLTSCQKVKILNCSLRAAYYFGILFNWTKNIVLYNEWEMERHAQITESSGLELAKNLVLETLYSILHRIEQLLTQLFQWVDQTLTKSTSWKLDPATLSCALSILYSSVNKFRKMKSSSIHVEELASPTATLVSPPMQYIKWLIPQ